MPPPERAPLELLTGPREAAAVELEDAAQVEGPIAVLRAPGDAPFPELQAQADRAEAVVIAFPLYRDGRGFTLAARLRERGFTGRIEAEGHVLPDQARHLHRCGFDAVRLAEDAKLADWERLRDLFPAAYQPAEDGAPAIWSLRTARA